MDINTTAMVQSGSQQNLMLGEQSVGRCGTLQPGDKVMIHVSRGKTADATEEFSRFSIRTVASFNGGVLTLDSAITEFIVSPSEYYIQVVKIPQFRNLNIASGGSLVPKAWNTTVGGGIVAAVVQGNCTVSGKIITTGKGITRIEQMPFCHSMMPDRFLLTGNVFLLCGGTLSGTGFIGNDWSGDGEGGDGGSGGAPGTYYPNQVPGTTLGTVGEYGGPGHGGASGYGGGGGGGGGGGFGSSATAGTGGTNGGIGCGGNGGNGGRAGYGGTPGGAGLEGEKPGVKFAGPTLLVVAGKISSNLDLSHGGDGGNGGPGGWASSYRGGPGGGGHGGGGTGFAYIAYKEVV